MLIPPQSSLITPPILRTILLRILPLLLLLSNPKLQHPSTGGNRHSRRRDPRQGKIFPAFTSVRANLVPVLVDDVSSFVLCDGDDDRGDEERHKREGADAPVGKTGEAGAAHEECDYRCKNSDSGGGDANCVENEGRVEAGGEVVEAFLDIIWPVDVRDVEVEPAGFEAFVDFICEVEVVWKGQLCSSLFLTVARTYTLRSGSSSGSRSCVSPLLSHLAHTSPRTCPSNAGYTIARYLAPWKAHLPHRL